MGEDIINRVNSAVGLISALDIKSTASDESIEKAYEAQLAMVKSDKKAIEKMQTFYAKFSETKELVERITKAKNLTEALNIDSHADDKAIKTAYNKLVLRIHPDKGKKHYPEKKVSDAFARVTSFYDNRINTANDDDADQEMIDFIKKVIDARSLTEALGLQANANDGNIDKSYTELKELIQSHRREKGAMKALEKLNHLYEHHKYKQNEDKYKQDEVKQELEKINKIINAKRLADVLDMDANTPEEDVYKAYIKLEQDLYEMKDQKEIAVELGLARKHLRNLYNDFIRPIEEKKFTLYKNALHEIVKKAEQINASFKNEPCFQNLEHMTFADAQNKFEKACEFFSDFLGDSEVSVQVRDLYFEIFEKPSYKFINFNMLKNLLGVSSTSTLSGSSVLASISKTNQSDSVFQRLTSIISKNFKPADNSLILKKLRPAKPMDTTNASEWENYNLLVSKMLSMHQSGSLEARGEILNSILTATDSKEKTFECSSSIFIPNGDDVPSADLIDRALRTLCPEEVKLSAIKPQHNPIYVESDASVKNWYKGMMQRILIVYITDPTTTPEMWDHLMAKIKREDEAFQIEIAKIFEDISNYFEPRNVLIGKRAEYWSLLSGALKQNFSLKGDYYLLALRKLASEYGAAAQHVVEGHYTSFDHDEVDYNTKVTGDPRNFGRGDEGKLKEIESEILALVNELDDIKTKYKTDGDHKVFNEQWHQALNNFSEKDEFKSKDNLSLSNILCNLAVMCTGVGLIVFLAMNFNRYKQGVSMRFFHFTDTPGASCQLLATMVTLNSINATLMEKPSSATLGNTAEPEATPSPQAASNS